VVPQIVNHEDPWTAWSLIDEAHIEQRPAESARLPLPLGSGLDIYAVPEDLLAGLVGGVPQELQVAQGVGARNAQDDGQTAEFAMGEKGWTGHDGSNPSGVAAAGQNGD